MDKRFHLMIGGPMGSGKNTAWRYIYKKWGHEYIAFANKMKFMAKEILTNQDWTAKRFAEKYTKELFGEDGPFDEVEKAMEVLLGLPCTADYRKDNEPYDLPSVEYGFEAIDDIFHGRKPRALLQEIGREFRRIDVDVWIHYIGHVIERYPDVLFCVCDMRLPLEADFGRRLGMKLIYLDAGRNSRVERLVDRDGECDQSKMNDITETSLDASQFENVIVNDGDLDALHGNINALMAKLEKEA